MSSYVCVKTLSVSLLIVLCSSVFAKQQEFRIGIQDVSYFPLYDFANKQGSYAQFMLDRFAEQYDYKFNYVLLPIKRHSRWLLEDKVDFRYPDNPQWDDGAIQQGVLHSVPTIKLVSGLIVAKRNQDWGEERIRRIGTLLGFHTLQWKQEIANGDVEIVHYSSTRVLLQKLLHGYVDALDVEYSVAKYHLRYLGKENEAVLSRNVRHRVYSYHLSTLRHKQIIEQFNQFLLDNQNYLKELRKQLQIIDHRPFLE